MYFDLFDKQSDTKRERQSGETAFLEGRQHVAEP